MTTTLMRPATVTHIQQQPMATPEKADEAARYIGQMTGEMALLARGARLDTLAYFLEMARIEAQTMASRLAR
ncbi:hypothetical protein [uncultured Alsobacter sp.]|uniref:hypothetical protein n=1 Tax=uncultured Alsobacter sp. TaxID=1748258 RepID=UPI0025E0C846|nr:hypothetical protein [uncultured Alsobacter sp.]